MAIPKDFSEMMPHTVTVYAQSSLNKYATQTFSSTGVNYQCRIMNDTRMIRDAEGREIVESGRAIIYGMATVTVKDRIVLPSGAAPLVTSVSHIKDENGDHHSVIGFG